ncbi:glycosyltransferase family 39 protein [Patescibacteria group bacterium]|nr:glycosyltransferase family 39 protein [Patescibacteria group bacterium]
MKRKHVFLTLILLFTAFIRLYKITTLPPALFYDEIDAGYQAMIFNQNQTDYYGTKFPFHFHSFGDFRTPLQIYSVALFQKLNLDPDLAVRLPSAIYGILSVFVLYLITQSLVPVFLLAISPWAIHYSRIGFEVSGMLLFIFLGIYFWQKFLQNKKTKNLYLTAFFFCLSPYFYSTAKLFIIIIALLLALIWQKSILKFGLKKLILPLLFAILLLSPLALDTIKGNAGYRFSYISIFTMPHREQIVDTLRYQDASTDHQNQIGLSTSLSSRLFHNKYQLVVQRFISNYVSSFSSDFLFLKGDNNVRHGFGNHGLLYLLDFVFILMGLFSYFSTKPKRKLSTLFFWLLVFSPIPYALTRDSDFTHATRLILMLPSIIYFSYLGVKFIQSKSPLAVIPVFILYFLSFLNFWHYYYYHYPQESARAWNTGMKEAVLATNDYPKNAFIFSDDYISFVSFFLYYHPYQLNPGDSLENHLKPISNDSFSGQVIDDKYYFGHVNWRDLSDFPPNSLYVLPASEYNVPNFPTYPIVKEINKKYENQESFYLIEK